MKKIKWGAAIAAICLLSACTPPEPMDFSLGEVPIAHNKIPCRLQSIAVTVETAAFYGNGKYGTRPPALSEFRDPLKSALEDGFDRSALFNYGAPSYCAFEAKILGIKQAEIGITFPADLYVSFTLNSLNTGNKLVSATVTGHGETPLTYNWIGIVRMRHSLILSGQDAARVMIEAVEEYASAPSSNQP
ncbi:YajG family lipoprotein [Acidocella facilis]|uniref:hypothetical protein n=1 Tax=Acidocella facilis TaxID=525 RepID=UPI001F231BD2|nr:hypothetical protein [Acidocella facilis]